MTLIVPGQSTGPAPLLFFYTHLHDAIREELDSLSEAVLRLENIEVQAIASQLTRLRERYRFLEQVYKYHSSVEDEVRAAISLISPTHPRHVSFCSGPSYAIYLLFYLCDF